MVKCKTRTEKNYFTLAESFGQSTLEESFGQRKYTLEESCGQRRSELCSMASAARYFFNFIQRAPKNILQISISAKTPVSLVPCLPAGRSAVNLSHKDTKHTKGRDIFPAKNAKGARRVLWTKKLRVIAS